jgi:sialic acid synthase SpsE
MVRDIRLVETALGDGIKRISEREEPIMKKLRRIDTVGSKGQLGSK